MEDDTLTLLKDAHDSIDILFAMMINTKSGFYPSKSGKPWTTIVKLYDKIQEVEIEKGVING